MKKFPKMLVVCAWLTIVTAELNAAIIYDNGDPSGDVGFWSDFDQGQQIADSFLLSSGNNTITEILWSGAYFSTNTPTVTDNFTLRIFADIGGVPAINPLHIFNVGNAVNRTDSLIDDMTFGTLGLDIYNYSASISSTTLTAGVTYWLSVMANTTGHADDWLWEVSSLVDAIDAFRHADSESWSNSNDNLAFKLGSSAVPVPSTVWLFISGLLGLVSIAKRKVA